MSDSALSTYSQTPGILAEPRGGNGCCGPAFLKLKGAPAARVNTPGHSQSFPFRRSRESREQPLPSEGPGDADPAARDLAPITVSETVGLGSVQLRAH